MMLRYGVQGFDSESSATEHAKATFTENDFMILHNKKCRDFAWVWPPEYGRSLICDSIIEVDRPNAGVSGAAYKD